MHHKATKQAKSTPTTHQKSNKAHQIHTKTKPKATKWAGIALKNSHSHPTPTSHLITCFGRYWCSNLRRHSQTKSQTAPSTLCRSLPTVIIP